MIPTKFVIYSSLVMLFTIALAYSKESIAILDFEANGITISEAKTLTDKFRYEIIQLEKYQVIERSQSEAILKEQGFQQLGCTSMECAVEIGRLIGVSKIFAGSIGKIGTIYAINCRIIDVETAKILQYYEIPFNGNIEDLYKKGMVALAAQIVIGKINVSDTATVNIKTRNNKDTCSISVSEMFASLYSEPNTRSDKLFTIPNGTILFSESHLPGWYQVDYKKTKCFIRNIDIVILECY